MEKTSQHNVILRERIYENLGHLTQAMAAPARLRILQILSNKPCTVESLSQMIDETVGNTSQHLQKMLRSGLVRCEKNGVSRIYSLSNNKVLDAWLSLQDLASDLIPQIQSDEEELCPLELCSEQTAPEILKQVKSGKAILIDARMLEEFESTPVFGALHIPNAQLNKHLSTLPKSKTIFIFCRGRYCPMANATVIALRKKGYKAFRMKETSYQINKAYDFNK